MDSIEDEDMETTVFEDVETVSFANWRREHYDGNQSKQTINDEYVQGGEPTNSNQPTDSAEATSIKVGPKKRTMKASDSKVTKRPKMSDDEGTTKSMIILGLKCPQSRCDLMFESVKQLHLHQKSVHGVLPYPCLVAGCSQQFDNNRQIGSHYSTVHSHHTDWTCAQCNVKKPNPTQLRDHIRDFHQFGQFHCAYSVCIFEAELRFKVKNHQKSAHPHCICPIDGCAKTFVKKSKLQRHLQSSIHSNTKSTNSKVASSTSNTSTQADPELSVQADSENRSVITLQDAMTSDESTNSRMIILELKCTQSECDMKFTIWDQLYQHLESAHGVLRYPCLATGCSEQFNSCGKVGPHIRIIHPNYTNWTCPHCNVVCVSQTSLRTHLKIHDNFGRFRCSQVGCNFEANNPTKMYTHFKTHVRHICSIDGCDRVFDSKISLERHQQSVHFA